VKFGLVYPNPYEIPAYPFIPSNILLALLSGALLQSFKIALIVSYSSILSISVPFV
jgi:hypothetical protein